MSDKTDPRYVVNPPPTVDPTVLTTTQLLREVERVKELFDARLAEVQHVHAGRLERIDLQLGVIEQRRRELKDDTAKAVDTAFKAAAEQSALQFTTFNVTVNGLQTVVNDLKERVVKMESMKIGALENHDTRRADYGLLVAFGSLLVALAAVVVAVLMAS